MNLATISRLAAAVLATAIPSLAVVARFGPTKENISMTGLGGDSAGRGQFRVTWGDCTFDGTRTACTVTAPFTGIGPGGTIAMVLTYPGNGQSPLITSSKEPGGDALTGYSLSGSGAFVTTATLSDGTIIRSFGPAPFNVYSDQTCTVVSTCRPGLVGLREGATITGRMTGSFDFTPTIRANQGVISASAFGAFGAVAPGTWIEIYGTNLATVLPRTWSGADFDGVNAPTALAGTAVTVGGKPAFIDYASPTQVNVQVPSDVTAGAQPVIVTTAGGASTPFTVQVNPVQPGLLAPGAFQVRGIQHVAALFPDGATFVLPPGVTTAVPTRRAKAGDTILLYGIGFGRVTPDIPAGQIVQQANALADFQISFGGTPAKVSYSGLGPNFVGLYQFNVVVPEVAAGDAVPLAFSTGGTRGTQNLVIAIGN